MKRTTFVIQTPSVETNKFDWLKFKKSLIISKSLRKLRKSKIDNYGN